MMLFLTALGLMLVIEGFFYGGVPSFAKKMAAMVLELEMLTVMIVLMGQR